MPVIQTDQTPPTRLMRVRAFIQSPIGGLILLVLALLGAAVALREHSVEMDFAIVQDHLQVTAYNTTVDFGPLPDGERLAFYNTGPDEKRSPPYLIRSAGLFSDVRFLLATYGRVQQPIEVPISELREGRGRFLFWNPFHPAVEVRVVNGPSLGYVRFRVHDSNMEAQLREKHIDTPFPAPMLKLMFAGLSFSLLSGCALFLLISLLSSATAGIFGRGTPPPPSSVRAPASGFARFTIDYQWVLAFVLGTLWIGYVHYGVFKDLYGFGDEMNYLIQARILASGHVALAQPTDADFFKVSWMDLMVGDGKIWNFHPIGNSLLLAVGMLVGHPGIMPPLVGGGIFAALFALARRLVNSSAFAWLCVLVAASSQYTATVSASFMAHGPALLFIELATLTLVIFWQTNRERYVVLTGALLGVAFIMRPLSAVLIGVIPAVLLLVALIRRKVRFRTLVLAAVVGLAIASIECWRTYLTAGQFTLAYMVKGPEANMTFWARWARGWDFRIKTTYLNYRYYHNRIFGLGFAGNLAFFFIPLVAASRLWWVRLSYLAIVIYWVAHSFLHFYGWMWEPRMLFEFTHLTVLLTAYGMWLLITYQGAGRGRINPIAAAAAVAVVCGFLGFNIFYDLPERFRTEYYHYNKTDPYVRDQIREQGIRNAIFFYKEATAGFAPHSGDNAIAVGKNGEAVFEGNVIHAIHLGNLTDYALISRYPDRRVFLVQGAQSLQEQPNFYRGALPKLAAALSQYQGTHEVAVGIPWMDLADPKALSAYSGIKFFDDQGFFSTFVDGTLPNRPFVVALVGDMKNYTEALREVYAKVEPIAADDLGYPVSIVEVDPSSRRAINGSLGLQMNVHRVAKEFKAAPFTPTLCLSVPAVSQRVGLVHFDASSQVFVCAEWSGEFYLDAPATYTFALVSDDGAGIVIDGKTVIDKGMFKSNDGPRQEGTVHLDAGRHTFYLTYVQIQGAALFEVEVKKDSEPFAPLNMASLGGVMRVRRPDEVANRSSLMGLGPVVMGTSTPVDNIDDVTPGEPIVEVIDPGPDEGSLNLRFPKPYSLKDYPYVQFYYKMAPDTAYSILVRPVGASDFIELPMRVEQPRREGKTIGAFNAQQDNQWHLMKFDLYQALGSRDVSLEEAIMGEWAGAAERRTLHFKDFCVGPYKAQISVRGPDNQVRLIPSPISAASANGPIGEAPTAPGPCPLPVAPAERPQAAAMPVSVPADAVAKQAQAQESARTATAPAAKAPTPQLQRAGAVQSPRTPAPVGPTPTPGGPPQLIDRSALRVSSFREDAPEMPGKAIDGSQETRWDTGRPQVGGEWFRIDLTQPVRLMSLVLDTGTFAQDYPRHLDVFVSADGDTFEPVAALGESGTPTKVTLDKPVQACSIRLQQTGHDPTYYWSIHELQVWGVPLPGQCTAAAQPTAAPPPPPTPTNAAAAAAPLHDARLDTPPESPADHPRPLRVSTATHGGRNTDPTVHAVVQRIPVEGAGTARRAAAVAGAQPAETEAGRVTKAPAPKAPRPRQQSASAAPSPTAAAPHAATPLPGGPAQWIDRSVLRVSSYRRDAPAMAGLAIDGSQDTRWDTGTAQKGGEWFRIDLTQPVQLASLVLDTGTFARDYPRHLDVFVSTDGEAFQQVAALDGKAAPTKVDLDKPVQACSIRLEQNGSDSFYYWSIHELQVWGVPVPGQCAAAAAQEAAPTVPPTPTAAPEPVTLAVERSELRVSSSRADAPQLAASAIDEFNFSRWDTGRPQVGGEWFRVDLPGIGELSRIRLLVEGSPLDYPRLLEVSTSTDGTHFEPVTTVVGRAPYTDVLLNPPVRCQAVRLEQKGADPRYFWAINTLQLWGTFPKRQFRWWEHIPYPAAWLALSTLLLIGVGTVMTRLRRPSDAALNAAVQIEASTAARRWRKAGILTAVLFGMILIATQNDYGETWDEWEHFANGEQYYQYLFGNGKTPELYGHSFRKYYAPFSDIVAASIKHLVTDQLGLMSKESAIHLHLMLLFVAGGVVLFLTILPEYGGRAAYLCLLVYFASPHLLGHCHNNMKDFGITGWTVVAVFAFYTGVRRRSYPGMALAGLIAGMSLATKINGVVLAPMLLIFVLLFVVLSDRAGEPIMSRLRFAVLGCGVVYWTTALAAMILLWPWLWAAPWARFWETASFFQHHIWNGLVLYKGSFIPAAHIPRDYAPYYVLITTPIAWLPFAAAGMVRAGVDLTWRRLLFALLALAFLTPIAVEVFTSVPIYDGVRHFLPAFPFLACLVGFGMDWLLTVAQRTRLSRVVAWLVVGVAIGSAIVQDIRIHPYQSTYFNTLAGGGRGAMGQFELDYWASSLKEAGRWVNEHAPPKSKVDVILGLHGLAGLRQDLVGTDLDPDYAIVLNRESLAPDPYKDRTPIYSVTADGAVLTRVYKLTPP